ncbi:MAG TPA: YbaK/EbsC family protein [Anaerolineales bacterium]|nr:YbaK/EbsC family protein [Anaerolineales bacterium]
MKFHDLQIQTQREFPSNMRTEGFGWLVRAGYITRAGETLPLGRQAIARLQALTHQSSSFSRLALPVLANPQEIFFPAATGSLEVMHCPSCGYTARQETARFKRIPFTKEEPLRIEKVLTPDCNTIESLAKFLSVPKEKTTKALMFTRLADGKFVFAAVRGDMQLSETKLKTVVGEFRTATAEEILKSGAAAGFASPIGLRDALVVADELLPASTNLVAGANEAGYHFKNTNYGRDYRAEIVADVAMANAGYPCAVCEGRLDSVRAELLAAGATYYFENILYALAETYHDEKGLAFPDDVAPFDVYLMHIPGRESDTLAPAEEIHRALQTAGLSVLFDDRAERAGVKFNDADLIGCPIRITVGEKNLREGMVELKPRKAKENRLISLKSLNGLEGRTDLWALTANETT